MQLYFTERIENDLAYLDADESRHLTSVLRHSIGDVIQFTDGKGGVYLGELIEASKKQAVLRIEESKQEAPNPNGRLHVAISLLKMNDRLEWFLEKATELGVDEITPMVCDRSERRKTREDRLDKILIAATKQSLRAWRPVLNPLSTAREVISNATETVRCIPWCDEPPSKHLKEVLQPKKDTLILIGPEGDFSPEEVAHAKANGFVEASLGQTRLRAETAGIFVVAIRKLLDV
ncbi:MAG: RsmE family RNA methyltransferase [Saprospiraceae bacterium]